MLVGAVAAYYKYGDRTDVTDKSLKGTRDAVNALKAYLGSALAEAVRPTVERVVSNFSPETAAEELRGETFLDDVSAFVDSDIDEMLSYGRLIHARDRWSSWARRMSWGVLALLIVQGLAAFYFSIFVKIVGWNVTKPWVFVTFGISGLTAGFCIFCAIVMLYHHDQICNYRDKVL